MCVLGVEIPSSTHGSHRTTFKSPSCPSIMWAEGHKLGLSGLGHLYLSSHLAFSNSEQFTLPLTTDTEVVLHTKLYFWSCNMSAEMLALLIS